MESATRPVQGKRRPPGIFAESWFGVVSYEFGLKRHGLLPRGSKGWDFSFFRPGAVLVYDRWKGSWTAFGRVEGRDLLGRKLGKGNFRAANVRRRDGKDDYLSRVRLALEAIAAGELYQANLSQSFEASWRGQISSLYETLMRRNPGPFMGLFQGRGFTVASSSPERLFSLREGRLEARPIAGTRPRGRNRRETARWRRQLRASPKERAEHLMLVDLARNDLGRVARYGSVRVDDFARVETYAKVQHLVSTVEGRLRPDVPFSVLFDSIFPGGTITGCPKHHCMRVLTGLETRPRGFYTGAMGYLAPGPAADLNILIRSMTLWERGLLEFHAGAGIVADSKPEREYLETLHKVEALAASLGTSLMEGR